MFKLRAVLLIAILTLFFGFEACAFLRDARERANGTPASDHGQRYPSVAENDASAMDKNAPFDEKPALGTTGNPATAPLKWSGLLVIADSRKGRQPYVMCTGQFISERVVLTAAHCIQDPSTGDWYDPNNMYFLLQYQHGQFTQRYRPICASRFDGWMSRGEGAARYDFVQWDYAMILMDKPSATGHYNWTIEPTENNELGTATGYPDAILQGEIIQKAEGKLGQSGIENVLMLTHKTAGMRQGSSGGAWVTNFNKEENGRTNVVVGLSSLAPKDGGVSFGPALTKDFSRLFDYVSSGCPN